MSKLSDNAAFGLAVSNLHQSVRFYRDCIGLSVDSDTGIPDTALLTTHQNYRFLLAGPDAPEWPEILAGEYTVLAPGEKIFTRDPDFDQRLERLGQLGVEFALIERPWGDRMIEAPDPDGYGVTIQAIIERTNDEVEELLGMARTGLREATGDLTARELSWRPDPAAWSIREVTHHVADASLTVLHAARVGLAEPGKRYHSNPYDQNHYASELRYQEREIEPALALFEATIDVLCSMTMAVPGSWARSITTPDGGETTVKTYLEMLAVHSLEHLVQIDDIRQRLAD